MPATPADIAAASRDVVVATWSDATIAGRYPSARDGSVQPEDGFFDAIADAQTVINARGALIGAVVVWALWSLSSVAVGSFVAPAYQARAAALQSTQTARKTHLRPSRPV